MEADRREDLVTISETLQTMKQVLRHLENAIDGMEKTVSTVVAASDRENDWVAFLEEHPELTDDEGGRG